MFIREAFAQTAETLGAGAEMSSGMSGLIQFVLVILVIYFILIRPQQKRIKKHEMELQAIIVGTQVVVGGFLGKVVEISDGNKLTVELAEGVRVTVLRPYVSQVIFETPADTKKK